jgi:hypothetical protein
LQQAHRPACWHSGRASVHNRTMLNVEWFAGVLLKRSVRRLKS